MTKTDNRCIWLSPYEDNELLQTLPCFHRFLVECLKRWFANTNGEPCCPIDETVFNNAESGWWPISGYIASVGATPKNNSTIDAPAPITPISGFPRNPPPPTPPGPKIVITPPLDTIISLPNLWCSDLSAHQDPQLQITTSSLPSVLPS